MTKMSLGYGGRNNLIGMALDFASFLISNSKVGGKINSVILFGSVARGDFDSESDVDIFVDSGPENEKEIRTVLGLWEGSKRAEQWRLLGAKNGIALHIGKLESWEAIHRAIISEGLMLYGKYTEPRKGGKQFLIIYLSYSGMKRKEKISIWRKLYGYRQKINDKTYYNKGILEELGGIKSAPATIMLPAENSQRLFDFLKAKKIKFSYEVIWSD